MATIQRIKLHKGQTRAWKSNAKIVAMISGTGSGKTFMGALWLYREIQKYPKDAFLVVSPTYLMFDRVVLPMAKGLLDELTHGVYRAVEKTYILPTGGKVFFGSADNPLTLEGVHVRAAWMDEAGQMKREAWDVVLRRTGFHGGRVLITTTPYNLGWLKTEVFDRWKAGDSNYDVIQFPSIENPYYPREEFERAKRDLPDWMFRMFYLGEFARPEGLVYDCFNPSVHLVEPFDIPKDWPRVIGVDFGYNNPFAAIWLAVDPDNNVFAYKEYYQREKLPSEAGEEIKRMCEGERIDAVVCDPSRPEAIEELRQLGLPAQSGNNVVLHGIQKVSEKMQSKQLFFFRGLENTLNEIEAYSWKVTNGAKQEQPVKEFDHLMDAMRYAIMYITSTLERRNVKGIDILRGARIYDKSV